MGEAAFSVTTRDDARYLFKLSGIDPGSLNREDILDLRKRIDKELRESGLIQKSFRVDRMFSFKSFPEGMQAQIRCKSYYFDNREAVSPAGRMIRTSGRS